MITLQTRKGLNYDLLDVTSWQTDVDWFIDMLYDFKNYTILVNFLPDANGDWYDWGQNPFKFIEAYQFMAIALKENLPNI